MITIEHNPACGGETIIDTSRLQEERYYSVRCVVQARHWTILSRTHRLWPWYIRDCFQLSTGGFLFRFRCEDHDD